VAHNSKPAIAGIALLLALLGASGACSKAELPSHGAAEPKPAEQKMAPPEPKEDKKEVPAAIARIQQDEVPPEPFPVVGGVPGGLPGGVVGGVLGGIVGTLPQPASAPPPPPPPPGLPLVWNAWIEDDSPLFAFQPVQSLKPSQDYIVGVDLAPFAYKAAQGAIESRPASSSLRKWLDAQNKDVVRLKALVVPDPAFFTKSAESFVDLTIDRRSIDRYYALSPIPPQPPDLMSDLRTSTHPAYRFGYLTSTPLKVHTGAGREGRTYLAISFWNGIEPLDSIVVPVCVSRSDAAGACGSATDPIVGISNAGRWNVGTPDPGAETPAASLHFIETPTATLAVLLAAGAASDPVTWQIDDTLEAISRKVATLLANYATAGSDEFRRDTGQSLFDALVPPANAAAGREAFKELLAERRKPDASPDPPVIWVRVDPQVPSQIFSIPLALAALDREMLGDWFRVQSTLRRQDYRPLDACISNWVKLLPPPGAGDFEKARPFMAERIPGGFTDNFGNNPLTFSKWMRDYDHPVAEPTVLLTLSHYFKGGISFNQHDWVAPDAILRSFTQPSVALIEGCDGAEPGADDFLQRLNMVGFQAIITTTGPVKAYMAGQYFKLLSQVLEDKPGYTLSQAHFEAVKELKNAKPENSLGDTLPYGLSALIFSLLGDGSLKVCPLHP
jgi:hypothetical protein